MGETRVSSPLNTVNVCPWRSQNAVNNSYSSEECSCLPTVLVEQSLNREVNPLGSQQKMCVNLNQKMVFPDLEGITAS